jgi:hypothetical protein
MVAFMLFFSFSFFCPETIFAESVKGGSLEKIIETGNILQKLRMTQEMGDYAEVGEKKISEKPVLSHKGEKRTVFIYKNTDLASIITDLFYKQSIPEFLLSEPESPFWKERHTGAFVKESSRFRLLSHVSDLFGFSLDRKGTTYILYPPQSLWLEKMLSRFPELNAPVSLDMKEVSVVKTLEHLMGLAKLNYILDDSLAGEKLSIKLQNATIGAALQAIAIQKFYEIVDANGVFVVFRRK